MGAFAVLKQESPFHSIFPAGWVPIFPTGPEHAALGRVGEVQQVYMLDLRRCTEFQLNGIAEALSKTQGGTVEEVRAFLDIEKRIPVRISQVERIERAGFDLREVI